MCRIIGSANDRYTNLQKILPVSYLFISSKSAHSIISMTQAIITNSLHHWNTPEDYWSRPLWALQKETKHVCQLYTWIFTPINDRFFLYTMCRLDFLVILISFICLLLENKAKFVFLASIRPFKLIRLIKVYTAIVRLMK